MTNNDRFLDAQGIQQTHYVANQVEKGVLINCHWTFRLAIATHIRRHGAKPSFSKHRELMTPGVPCLREAVTEENNRSFSLFGHMNADSIGLNYVMFQIKQ
jgi:hypothetical protein